MYTESGSSFFEIESKNEKKEKAALFYETLITSLKKQGGIPYTDVGDLYRELKNETCIVRREDPKKILETFGEGKELSIARQQEDRVPYANAVEWKLEYGDRGISAAFLEGHGDAFGIVTIVAFERGVDLDVERVPSSQRATNMDHQLMRTISGSIHPQDVRFVIIRIPIDRFPVEEMTEAEREKLDEWREDGTIHKKATFLFRGITFEKGRAQKQAA
ncbi:hypothetical protein KBD18_02210 [Patescibacteria group bacterium]|nr:hypothetical protein [Patescibacteria group bacterium]